MQRYGLLAGTGIILCGGIAVAIYAQKPEDSTARKPASSAPSAKYAVVELPKSHLAAVAAQAQVPGVLSAAATPPVGALSLAPLAASALASTDIPQHLAAGARDRTSPALVLAGEQPRGPVKALVEAPTASAAASGPSPQLSGTPAGAVPYSSRPEDLPQPAREAR